LPASLELTPLSAMPIAPAAPPEPARFMLTLASSMLDGAATPVLPALPALPPVPCL
jgi:hypothetical protein